MRRLLRLTIVLVSSAVTGAVLTGSTWFLIAYANHPAALGDRGFFTVGPGFVGLLGANIGLVQGGLLGTLVASFRFTPTAGALVGAALGGGMLLLLGMRLGAAAMVMAPLLAIGSGTLVGWSSAHLWRRLQSN